MNKIVNNNHLNYGLVHNTHTYDNEDRLVFSFNKFQFKPIKIEGIFNNYYKDKEQFVDKISIFLGKALPLLSQERISLFEGKERDKAKALHLHMVNSKREIIEEILSAYNFSKDEIDDIFEGEEVYQLEIPYTNGATRVVFQRIDNLISFLFMDPNHHVYFNEKMEEAKRALFYEYCPVNEKQQCVRMEYFNTCFAFEFLDEQKYKATWDCDYDPTTETND